MGLFSKLFKRDENKHTDAQTKVKPEPVPATSEWEEVPAFIEADEPDYQLVSVIATALAAGDNPDSQFVVKKILQRNPEAKLVSIIASSIAAGDSEESQLVVKRIAKKK